jgi:hypothetical protein
VTRSRFQNSTPLGTANQHYRTRTPGKTKQVEMHWSLHPEKRRGLYTTDKMGGLKVRDTEYRFPPDYDWICDGKLRSPWYDAECLRRGSDAEIAQELDMVFHGSGASYFSETLIEELLRETVVPPYMKGNIVWDQDAREARFEKADGGMVHLWMHLKPDSKVHRDAKYAMGIDVAAGNGASNSVIVVADVATGEQVLEYVNARIDPVDLAELACAIAHLFNNAFMAWDGAGHGIVFKNRVLEHGYGNIYFNREDKTPKQKVSMTPGVFKKGHSRVAMFADYRDRLTDRRYVNRSKDSVKEHRQFEYSGNTIKHSGSVVAEDPSGANENHGDRVTAAVICCLAMAQKETPLPKKSGVPPPGTYGAMWNEDREPKRYRSQWD